MRIAFLADPLDRQYGGIHVYIKELLRAIAQLNTGHDFLIIRSKESNEFSGMEELVIPWKNYPGYRVWRLFVEIPRILKKRKVDVVIEPAHFGPFNLPRSIKRVTVIHDMTMFLFPQDHLFFSQFLQKIFLPSILRKADHIITNSQNTSNDLVQFFSFTADKNTAILLGKNKIYRPTIQPAILGKHGIRKPYFLYVGTLEPRKNIPLLIQAFNQYKAQTEGIDQLVLIGKKGWKSQAIFQAIAASDYKSDILHLGYIETVELPVFYSMTTAFVYPSKYEGFGLPVLEAMACGAPVITTKVSSLVEVAADAGLYFTAGSVLDLTRLLIDISSDQLSQKKWSKKSIQRAANFSWEKTAQQTIEIFENIESKA